MRRLGYTILNVIAFQFLCFGQDTIRVFPDSSHFALNAQERSMERSLVVNYGTPVLFLAYGLISLESKPIRRVDNYFSHELFNSNLHFSTNLDDHLRYVPVIVVYSLNAFGIKGKNNFIDRSAIYLISNLLLSKSVDFLKDKTHRLRPSKADFRAFPSGHTALAFAAAEFMRMEYKEKSPWYGYAAYSAAAATGAIKMIENDHWFSDVLAGAGIGILSSRASYLIYPWLKEKVTGKKDLEFRTTPFIGRGFVGLSLAVKFK